MSGRHEPLRAVSAWIEKPEHDLCNAEFVLTMPANCPTDTVCFHAQQCAEKYLKALLTFLGVDFPRTHDLAGLLNLLRGQVEPGLSAGHVQPLNRYSIEARYPGDWDPIDVKEATEAVAMARRVREAVRSALPDDVLYPSP